MDYAASTPVDPSVEAAMKPYFGKVFGNPHSLHQFGQEASRGVFEARQKIADSIGADYQEIVFTGSATEANNLAIRGMVRHYKLSHPAEMPRIVVTTIEHESVLETCRDLEKEEVEIIYVPVSREGIFDPKKIKSALNNRTVLVSVMHANNEVGTIQPIAEIAKIIKSYRTNKSNWPYPLFHTDAVQSFQYLDCNVQKLGMDLMTISAHKIYGPKGIGALYIKNSVRGLVSPIITGSGQEGGVRSGTDNVPYIVGFGKAVEVAKKLREGETKRIASLRDYFWKSLKNSLPKLVLNGSLKHRLPNNLNIYFPGQKSQELLVKLDLAGIAVSPGAACNMRAARGSYVLDAMGHPMERSTGSLRFSLGRMTAKKDIDAAITAIASILAERKF